MQLVNVLSCVVTKSQIQLWKQVFSAFRAGPRLLLLSLKALAFALQIKPFIICIFCGCTGHTPFTFHNLLFHSLDYLLLVWASCQLATFLAAKRRLIPYFYKILHSCMTPLPLR